MVFLVIWILGVLWAEITATQQANSFCDWASSGRSFAEITRFALLGKEDFRTHKEHDREGKTWTIIMWSSVVSYFGFDRKSMVMVSSAENTDSNTSNTDASVSVTFTGVPPFSRYDCTIFFRQGKVVSTEIGYAD
jgi:hypothetical protein